MNFETIIYEKKEGIATITLNRPHKLNALSLATYEELDRALDAAEADPEVKVLVLTGAGDRAFCAGDDINTFEGFTPASARSFLKKVLMPIFLKIEKLDKPVIAAVNGMALGGGFELALISDITIASEKATFGLPEPRLGLYSVLGVIRLADAIGVKRARELMLTCDTIDAREAERIGLVNKVVPADQLEAAARETAQKIMSIAPLSASLTKAALNRMLGGEDIEYSMEALAFLFCTEDHKEGFDAFMKRRKPEFKER